MGLVTCGPQQTGPPVDTVEVFTRNEFGDTYVVTSTPFLPGQTAIPYPPIQVAQTGMLWVRFLSGGIVIGEGRFSPTGDFSDTIYFLGDPPTGVCEATVPVSQNFDDPPVYIKCRLDPNTGQLDWFLHEGTVDNRGDTLASGQATGPFQAFVSPTEPFTDAIKNGQTNINLFPSDGGPPLVGNNLPCKRTATTGCLTPRAPDADVFVVPLENADRYEVKVTYGEATGSGNGTFVPLSTGDSGIFNLDDTEMLLKMLDGCSDNGHFWVFAAAATTVEYTLTVTDTATGQSRVYGNELGQVAPAITDTSAFATCP